jgi:hypothetical protein
MLDGKDSTAFLEGVPVPLELSYTGAQDTLGSTANHSSGVAVNALQTHSVGTALKAIANNGSATAIDARGAAFGVDGIAWNSTGIGVRGFGNSSTGVNYGVRGSTNSGTDGFGVFSNGNMGASGTKPFRIDHPFDPTNKYLFHYSAESPLPQNFYNGNVRTDASGQAWVTLPDYFEEINKDFRYTLTVVDDTDSPDFVQVKVAKKIQGNRFKIRTSAPNVEVSWRVDALRSDKWVQKNPPLTEPLKEGPEKGTYQQPELYGQPAEMGINHERTKQRVPPPPSK